MAHYTCTSKLPGLKRVSTLQILHAESGVLQSSVKLDQAVKGSNKGLQPVLGHDEQCLWSPMGSHLLLTFTAKRHGGVIKCVDLRAPQKLASMQVHTPFSSLVFTVRMLLQAHQGPG